MIDILIDEGVLGQAIVTLVIYGLFMLFTNFNNQQTGEKKNEI